MKKIFYLIIVIVALVSCSSPNEPKLANDLFPLNVGNTWSYNEVFTSYDTTRNPSYERTYATTIMSIEEVGGYDWYKLESLIDGRTETRYLMAENDSIYELQYAWSDPVRALSYIIPKEKEEVFTSWWGGDVETHRTAYILDTTITTPAGKFKNCFMFEVSNWDFTVRDILALGVGIIEKQRIGFNFMTGEKIYHRTDKLINYNIK